MKTRKWEHEYQSQEWFIGLTPLQFNWDRFLFNKLVDIVEKRCIMIRVEPVPWGQPYEVILIVKFQSFQILINYLFELGTIFKVFQSESALIIMVFALADSFINDFKLIYFIIVFFLLLLFLFLWLFSLFVLDFLFQHWNLELFRNLYQFFNWFPVDSSSLIDEDFAFKQIAFVTIK